jgi:protocatechuate 3,4-dioxygenase alpha subunit
MSGQTPWQTVGPYFHYGLPWKGGADMTGDSGLGARLDLIPDGHYKLAEHGKTDRSKTVGERIEIYGCVYDHQGKPIPDAMIEIWQANSAGRYASQEDTREEIAKDPAFIGFGRSSTDANGIYRFRTIKPGRVPGPGNSLQAPHIAIGVFARGMLKRSCTRFYFPEAAENLEDPILALVPEDRRKTLIGIPEKGDVRTYRLDLRFGGDLETVFFDV